MSALDLLAEMHTRARWLDATYIGSDLHEKVIAELETRDNESACFQNAAHRNELEVQS